MSVAIQREVAALSSLAQSLISYHTISYKYHTSLQNSMRSRMPSLHRNADGT